MKFEQVNVDVKKAVKARLSLYIQENYPELYGERKRPMILICPGGGYEHVSVREEPVAFQFLAAGYHAAVLQYDVVGDGMEHPLPLLELAWTVAYIREHADAYAIDKDKIIVAGFSAGGHLAGCLGCFWAQDWFSKKTGMEKSSYRPNGLILAYPVITWGAYAHRPSFERLMGSQSSEELAMLLSLEKQVTDIPVRIPRYRLKIHSCLQGHCARQGYALSTMYSRRGFMACRLRRRRRRCLIKMRLNRSVSSGFRFAKIG